MTFPVVEPVDACSVLAFRLSLARTVKHLMSPDKVLKDANRGNVPALVAKCITWIRWVPEEGIASGWLSLVASLGTQKDLSTAVVVVASSIPGCPNVAAAVYNPRLFGLDLLPE